MAKRMVNDRRVGQKLAKHKKEKREKRSIQRWRAGELQENGQRELCLTVASAGGYVPGRQQPHGDTHSRDMGRLDSVSG